MVPITGERSEGDNLVVEVAIGLIRQLARG